MIRNYIVIAWRNLLKNKLFSFINIFGLALSMSVCMMVIIRTIDTFSYDRFHHNPDRTYRILSKVTNEKKDSWTMASTPLPLYDEMVADPSVESAAIFYPAIHGSATDGVKELPLNGAFTQPSFFKIFGFTLLHGDDNSALANPGSVVMSRAFAAKFFNDENPVGKTLSVGKLGSFQITGVMDEPPGKSHLNFDVLVSYSTIAQLERDKLLPLRSGVWNSFESAYTYVVLNKAGSSSKMKDALDRLSAKLNSNVSKGSLVFLTQKLSDISPSSDSIYNDIGRQGSWGKILAEVGISLIILFAACFNYTNLSLARALTRAKEVGIRKVAGAARWQVFAQYITEAIVVALLALCIGFVILSFILEFKPFNDGYEFMPDVKISFSIIAYFILFSVFAGLFAGSMPAWILSSFKPARILQSMSGLKIGGNITVRKVLMVFQFTLSLVILIFLAAFYQQFDFMASADMGFQRKNILSIAHIGKGDAFRSELMKIPGVERITSMSANFGGRSTDRINAALLSVRENSIPVDYYFTDDNTVDVMGLKILAGKNFEPSGNGNNKLILLNETGAKRLGFSNYNDAVSEQLILNDSMEVRIAGVFRDFYNEGVGNFIRPMMLRSSAAELRVMNIRLTAISSLSVAANVEKAWKRIYPDRAFSYSLLDDELENNNNQTATMSLLGFLAFMTIVIASLGLLGLVVYTVETRKKEISIRKVVGAGVYQLMSLLSKGFASLLLIAGCIALPLGYVFCQLFLQNFANRVTIGAGTLLLSFGLLLVIGLLAVLPQTYMASQENPSKNLSSE